MFKNSIQTNGNVFKSQNMFILVEESYWRGSNIIHLTTNIMDLHLISINFTEILKLLTDLIVLTFAFELNSHLENSFLCTVNIPALLATVTEGILPLTSIL